MNYAEIPVEKYIAYEIDKYAIETSEENFPDIEHKGDVFEATFSEYEGFDVVIGGSPCTHWSICKKNGRETKASGIGWDLFLQYVRAVEEIKPKYFLYENNKSMSEEIRKSICDVFGFEQTMINSALVSAQSRQRYYWFGVRNEDGTYSKIEVEQPDDRGILLKDVIEKDRPFKELSEREMDYMVRDHLNHRWAFCNKPGQDNKSKCIVANISKGVPYNVCAIPVKMVDDSLIKECGYSVYTVDNGKLLFKNKEYPIGINDGRYIMKHLSVEECAILQTIPKDYKFPVSNTQALKLIGNGWNINTIAYLLSHIK